MNNLNRKVKSTITTTLNTHYKSNNNNKVSVVVANTYLYCNSCGKSIHKNSILCYIFIDYFCSEKCHVRKHKKNLERLMI
jgi:hypothetical protein